MSGVARFGFGLVVTVLISGSAVACGPTGGQQGTNLRPCQSANATGCDMSKLVATCQGKGTRNITASPIALDDILYIQPMGLMIGAHVTPIDHGYIYIKGALANPPRQAAVFAPLDGNISTVSRSTRSGPNGTYDDYAVRIESTCTFRFAMSNLVRLAGGLAAKVGQIKPNEAPMPNYAVKAGELIGYTGLPTGLGIDIALQNDDLTLTGFINPAQYTAAEVWKTHMADLFDYTSEPLKSQLLALLLRDATPRWGKIDYDVDGKLVGNWFLVGSGGYAGLSNMRDGFSVGHLAVVYDGNDPHQVDVSFGNYQGTSQQFAVVGNTPDPATVDQTTGLVRYQLARIEHYSLTTGLVSDNLSYVSHIRTRAASQVEGTVLMQLVDTRSLKIEIFPGKLSADVAAFDSGVLMYSR
jgi:hypothetical protein